MDVGDVQSDDRFDAYIVGKRKNRVFVVDRGRCKGCKICVSVCPYDAIYMSNQADNPNKSKRGYFYPIENTLCTACKQCVYACPDFALSVHKLEDVMLSEVQTPESGEVES
jgi:formate hydrogenlyase subunit 6/NADH:ubiquinone oxidoreductase subunit I